MGAALDAFPRMPMREGFAKPRHVATQQEKLHKQAQRLVSQAFYGTLMKQMRQSPFRDPRFDGGRGGEAFNEMFDQHLSERMAGATNNPLVHSIEQKLDKKRPDDGKGHYIRDPYRHHPKTPAAVEKATLDVMGA